MKTGHTTDWILVVEDQPDLWLLLKLHLTRQFPQIPLVNTINGIAALNYLQNCLMQDYPLPRLVMTDLYVPELADGINLLRDLKQVGSPYQAVPVVVVSSFNRPADRQQAMQYGAAAYLVKPFDAYQMNRFYNTVVLHWAGNLSAVKN